MLPYTTKLICSTLEMACNTFVAKVIDFFAKLKFDVTLTNKIQ